MINHHTLDSNCILGGIQYFLTTHAGWQCIFVCVCHIFILFQVLNGGRFGGNAGRVCEWPNDLHLPQMIMHSENHTQLARMNLFASLAISGT